HDVMGAVQEAQESGFGSELTAKLDSIATKAVLADQKGVAQAAREAAAVVAQDPAAAAAALDTLAAATKPAAAAPVPTAAPEPDVEEEELLDIFLEEAREVVGNGLAEIQALAVNPGDISAITTLR